MADIRDCVRSLLPGRARLRHPMLHGLEAESCREVAGMLETIPGVTGVSINQRVGSLLITWNEAETTAETLLETVEGYAAIFFAAGAEDGVGVLRRKGAGLHHGAVVKPLSGDAAVLKCADASVHLPADPLGLRVDGRVEEHQNTILLIGAEARPDERERGQKHAARRKEPDQVDAAAEGHNNKDEQIVEHHAIVP